MPLTTLSKKELPGIIEKLLEVYEIYGPKPKGPTSVFEKINSPNEISLKYTTTILPSITAIYPVKETLFKYNAESKKTEVPKTDEKPIMLFGVHPCDITAINEIDVVMKEDIVDNPYYNRRENAVIIGTDCEPDEYCFCLSMLSDSPQEGFDIFVTDIGNKYVIETKTEKGEQLVERYFPKPEAAKADREKLQFNKQNRDAKIKLKINTEAKNLPLLFAGAYNNKIWEEIANERCFGCGSCNLVCPTCYCFNISDISDLSLKEGERVRQKDACLVQDFALVTSGENFRKNRKERLRHRMYRKFKYLMQKYGRSYCVGCGRCIRACTVKISPVEIINELLERF